MKSITRITKFSLTFTVAALFAGTAYAEIPDQEKEPAVTKSSAVDKYFKLKEDVYEKYGFDWQLTMSAMGVQRTAGTKDNSSTTKFDLELSQEFFDGKGELYANYVNISQLSGITAEEFAKRNGNLIQINDSDPMNDWDQYWYAHKFLDNRLTITLGKTDPVYDFAENRFADDDRANFQMAPLSTVVAKDRLTGSTGIKATYALNDNWEFGVSANKIPSSLKNPRYNDLRAYYLFNATYRLNPGSVFEGNYRVTSAVTEEEGTNKRTNGFIVSIDQDVTEKLGVFFKYDDTEIQTRANDIKRSSSLGLYHKHVFGRESDVFGLGLAQVKSDVGGKYTEWGSEAFYRINVTHWLKASLNLQVIEPAKASDTIVNVGARLHASF